MNDIHETPATNTEELAVSNSVLENAPVEEAMVETSATKLSQEEVVAQLRIAVEKPVEEVKSEVEALKLAFYKARKEEESKVIATASQEEGAETPSEECAAQPIANPWEEEFKQLLNLYKEKKACFLAEQEKEREDNLAKKQAILEQIKAMCDDSDNINKHYNEFQELQQSFKEITNIPAPAVSEMWKSYQLYVEQFYDLLKINKELRDYDFKKNLDIKLQLCEQAEELSQKEEVVEAFKALQGLHDEWRATGPVAKEERETLWNRFKEASTIINKKHQQHFESIKENELANEAAKTALCEQIEGIETAALKSFNAWEEQTKAILALQEAWKKIGFASRKMNNVLFERFRKSCDLFFQQKAEYFKSIKEEMAQNLEKKKALCEQAEALKESTDWKATTEQLVAIQKEWKSIGSVNKKYSDALWKRFIAACDHFFEQKAAQGSSQRAVETANMKLKKEVIAQIEAIALDMPSNEAIKQVRSYMSQWNGIGHVPFKEKDKLYKEYQAALDKQFKHHNVQATQNRLANFSSSIDKMAAGEGQSQQKLGRERDKLLYIYEQKEGELKTYKNNMGFFTVSSKKGGGLLKEMERKMEKLQEEMNLLLQKIELIDKNM